MVWLNIKSLVAGDTYHMATYNLVYSGSSNGLLWDSQYKYTMIDRPSGKLEIYIYIYMYTTKLQIHVLFHF